MASLPPSNHLEILPRLHPEHELFTASFLGQMTQVPERGRAYFPDNSTVASRSARSPKSVTQAPRSHLCRQERSSNFIRVLSLFRRKPCALVVCAEFVRRLSVVSGLGPRPSFRFSLQLFVSHRVCLSARCAGGPNPRCRHFSKFAVCPWPPWGLVEQDVLLVYKIPSTFPSFVAFFLLPFVSLGGSTGARSEAGLSC